MAAADPLVIVGQGGSPAAFAAKPLGSFKPRGSFTVDSFIIDPFAVTPHQWVSLLQVLAIRAALAAIARERTGLARL
jgi:hypothetical protein